MFSPRSKKGASARALPLAFLTALATPALAFAGESTYTIDGTVTISLQTAQAAAKAAGTASTLAKTGDAVLWLMAGIICLGICAVVAMRASRNITHGSSSAGGAAIKSQKGLLSAMVACMLVAILCFCQFATKAAYAAEELASVSCSGTVIVDENGKITSNSLTIENGSAGAIHVNRIQAPERLSGWSAAAPETDIAAADSYSGGWTTKDLSSDLLKELKSNNGEITLPMSMTVTATTYTVSFDTCGKDCTVNPQTVQGGATATQPATPACTDYEFAGWYTDKDYSQAFDFSTPITANLTLYAKWTVKGYWLADANAQDPATSIVKTMSEVDADIAAIKAGDATVSAEYSKYLSDDSVHLYTRWLGSTTDASEEAQDANKYVEFRVLQVGNHDKEGCNVTFQATHILPESASMNSKETNTGGWGATELRASMQEGGAIYKNFDATFTDKILTVSKASSKGDMSTEPVYSENKFWLLGYSEYTGAGVQDIATFEGSQYQYWSNMGVTYNNEKSWACLKFTTRAGNNPANLQENTLRCWERSPLLSENWSGSFVEIYCPEKTGKPGYATTADAELGVILAFCF